MRLIRLRREEGTQQIGAFCQSREHGSVRVPLALA